MIILQDSDASQTISFIPRSYSSTETYSVDITSETENKSVYSQSHTGDFSLVKYYRQLSAVYDLKENNFYMIEIKDSSNNIIFRDKIFCTNQQVLDYSVNNNNYTTHSSNNEFIII
jgi:hypothetical protein